MITAQDYQTALDAQSACNAAAVIKSLAEVAPRIRAECADGEEFNNRPILRLCAEQLAHLTRNRGYYDAYTTCETIADKLGK